MQTSYKDKGHATVRLRNKVVPYDQGFEASKGTQVLLVGKTFFRSPGNHYDTIKYVVESSKNYDYTTVLLFMETCSEPGVIDPSYFFNL
ncbi:hypothetical protein Ddye_000679 [Dipteronia dyeriana]|uniref:Uncharacterized protein n=1 Tax=Dipteronia dyeriana TaxID=168575 RepID=A0AAD9XMU3_9ROSI|nr:hypothetical protein Ddye_000679 [Dipteronia dyeriana]